jgi:hypothetical protein
LLDQLLIDVRFSLIADEIIAPQRNDAMCQTRTKCAAAITSLDHLVGGREQRRRDIEAEFLGGFQVDRNLEFGWLHDRQIGRPLTLEDSAGVNSDLPTSVGKARSVTDQSLRPRRADETEKWRNVIRALNIKAE